MNGQVAADSSGRLLIASPSLPRAANDVPAEREHGFVVASGEKGQPLGGHRAPAKPCARKTPTSSCPTNPLPNATVSSGSHADYTATA
jgi:hypothetical protein